VSDVRGVKNTTNWKSKNEIIVLPKGFWGHTNSPKRIRDSVEENGKGKLADKKTS